MFVDIPSLIRHSEKLCKVFAEELQSSCSCLVQSAFTVTGVSSRSKLSTTTLVKLA